MFLYQAVKKNTPKKKKTQKNPKQPNKNTFCCVLSNQSARSPSNICFLKRENSAVSLATLYHNLNLKNKNKIDPHLYTVCDCAELGAGPGRWGSRLWAHADAVAPGTDWREAEEGLRRSGWAGLVKAGCRARGRGLVQFPRSFVLKVCLAGFSP